MRAFSRLPLQLLLQLIAAALCTGTIEIRQSRNRGVVTGEGTWRVNGIATIQINGFSTFLCISPDNNALQWSAVNDFTNITQSTDVLGQLLTFHEMKESYVGEYVCRDTEDGSEARLNITTDNPAIQAAQSVVVVEQGRRADLVVYASSIQNNGAIVWYKGTDRIENSFLLDASTRLTFKSAQLLDDGVYNISNSILFPGPVFITKYTSITLRVYVRPMLISSPPPYQTVDEWISVVQLECRFSGTPVQVTWHTDSRAITGSVASSTSGNNETTSTLTLRNITVADGGWYQCKADIDFADVSAAHNTTISVTPRMLLFHTTTKTSIDGSVIIVHPSASLTVLCRSSGNPLWYRANGMAVSMTVDDNVHQTRVSNTITLKILSYNDNLSGRYSCRSNVGSLHLQRNITLTTDNPSISSDNNTLLHAWPGSTLQLVVKVLGEPSPQPSNIVWYRNGTLIMEDQQLDLSHDHMRLTIRNIGTQLYGVYQCNVTTTAGTSSFNFTVERPFEPSAEIDPSTRTVTIEGRTHFTCRVLQGTPPINIEWRYRGDGPLPLGVESNHDILNFDNVQSDHSGMYSCLVSNAWGTVEVSATLNVQAPPNVSIVNGSSTIELSSGHYPFVLMCIATGTPLPEVRWMYRHGNSVDLPDGVISNSSGNIATLMWSRPVDYTDAGLYKCVGNNVLGEHSATTSVDVTALPKITAIEPNAPTIRRGPNNDFVLPEGQLGTVLSCTAFGAPPPHIMWVTAEGMSLPDHVTSVTSSIESHDPNYVTAQLKWRRGFSASDVNSYKCVATNSIGNESLAVTLTTASGDDEVLIQLRILSLSCSHWQVSSAVTELTLGQVYSSVFSSLQSQCQCQLDANNLISESLYCSEAVDESTLYRAKLITVGNHTAFDVSGILTAWVDGGEAMITLNNNRYKIDTTCEVMVKSADEPECITASPSASPSASASVDDSNSNNTLLYGVAGSVALVIILIVLAVLLFLIWKRRRSSRILCKHIRNTLYISNSFQAHLNQVGHSTIINQQLQASDDTDGDTIPHRYESINDFPSKSSLPGEQSPRISSESHGTSDSGIHSRTHSCDRLMAQPSQSDVVSSPRSEQPSSTYSKCEDKVLYDEPLHMPAPLQYRKPSFDELHYMTGVQIIDDEKQPRLSYYTREQNMSHSQPLEMLDHPNHKYVFTEQRSCHSRSSELSQSYPHLQQQFKQPPEPYVEPVSLRGSLHSILGQNSQLDTMV